MRRCFDVLASAGGLLVLLPVFLILAAWIKLTSPGPVFFRAERLGRQGVPFRLYKFRTMVEGAHGMGPGITVAEDRRITPVGRFLRRTKLDELPQLINVLRGEMTFVGPRPEDPRYVAKRPELYRDSLRLQPGVTGAGSLLYRREEEELAGKDLEEEYFERILPRKLRADVEYAKGQTLRSDIALIFRTIFSMWS